ncbi:hypothetical protein [uncultured Xanthomonas sp.]|uniref:hypothetical protein n=1 Tax=uncultured Xanthomonas sp. TaxID=152831 RepID=UPI0025DF4DC0|nr:hypothetical protein [uncultured Xanthomonas sp.]
MASASTWPKSAAPRSTTDAPPRARGTAVFVFTAALLALLCHRLLAHGYMSDDAMAQYAKLLLLRDAAGFRIEYLGFLYAQASLYLGVLLGGLPGLSTPLLPYLVDVLAGATLVTLLWRDIAVGLGRGWAWALSAGVVIQPFFLWPTLSGNNQGLGLLVFYVAARALRHFRNDPEAFAYLRLAASLCLLFFVDERACFLALALAPWLFLIAPPRLMRQAPLAFYLVCYLPFLFAVGAWMYLNYMFFGDPLLFVRDATSAFRGISAQAALQPWLQQAAAQPWWPPLWLLLAGVVSAPLLLLLRHTRDSDTWRSVLAAAATVIGAGTLATWARFTAQPLDFLALLLVPAALVLGDLRRNLRWLGLALLLAGAVSSGWVIARTATSTTRDWIAALQAPAPPRHADAAQLGAWLAEARLPTLLDDRASYPVIVARGDAKQLILPFDPRFKQALVDLRQMPAQVVVSDPASQTGALDSLNRRFPQLWQQGLPGYSLVYHQGIYRVWRRSP